MFNTAMNLWCSWSLFWAALLFRNNLWYKPVIVDDQPERLENRLNWWEFTNWDDVAPQTWYVNGEVIEV